MSPRTGFLVALLFLPGADRVLGAEPFTFRDLAAEAGLLPHVEGIRGHGAAWGDVDGDGFVDLYLGTFHTGSGKPNLLLRNRGGKFEVDDQRGLRISTRATGIVFADLDNDGDLDLYVSSMPAAKSGALAQREGRSLRGCTLFRNDGEGRFTDVSDGNGACPLAFGGRGACVLDFDGDGLLDLLVGEDPLTGYNGSSTASSRLFRNLGRLQFEDVSRMVGLSAVPGLGVAAADVNGDGWPDFFLAANRGGNVLFLNDGRGKFREAPDSRKTFAWPGAKGDNMIAGVCLADVNADGRPDVVIGPHYDHPWRDPVPVRLYLNRGGQDGIPVFEDITAEAGLAPLGMKAPHVEVQDFDNDGRPDIYTSVVKFANGRPHPVIFRNLGLEDGRPRFRDDAWGVNDFPTPADRAVARSTDFFDRMLKERKVFYSAPGPSADFDNDGRLDLVLPSWWPEARTLLLRNETPGGRWLRVRVEGTGGVNRMGVGATVRVYPAGRLGDPGARLGSREIAVGYGYASGQPAEAHFGLGSVEAADVEVILPHGKGVVSRKGVKADRVVTVKQGE